MSNKPITNLKTICLECKWVGSLEDLLTAPNPFDSGDVIYGCPKCKSVDCFVVACDEKGCWEPRTCGTPTATVYRQTCGKHRPED